MATTFTSAHGHRTFTGLNAKPAKNKTRGTFATFVADLIDDLRQKPLQADHPEKHDMFREHINAMSISYFALIVLLIAASIPVLAYSVQYLVAY